MNSLLASQEADLSKDLREALEFEALMRKEVLHDIIDKQGDRNTRYYHN